MEKVRLIVSISGCYCAFHEMSFNIEYDLTNNEIIGDYDLDELRKQMREKFEHTDFEERDAVIVDGVYYIEW